MVRVGAVWPGPDDDERHLRMPFGDNGFGDVGGDVGLGAAGHQELRHPGVHAVDGRAGLAQRVDLGGVLDHSQPAQHVGGQHRHHAEHVGQRQQVQRGHRVGDGGRSGADARRRSASATSRYGSSPSTQSRTARPSSVTADSFSDASSMPRHHDGRPRPRRAAPARSAVRRSARASRPDSAGRSPA